MSYGKRFITFIFSVLFILLIACKSDPQPSSVSVIYRPLNSPHTVAPLSDSLVIPIVYTKTISLENLPVATKKEKFIAMILPSILVAKQQIERSRRDIMAIRQKIIDSTTISVKEEIFLNMLMKQYKVNHIDSLHTKMIAPPTSLVLAQAAIECGWGTSRFFTEGCNVFGIWSFNQSDNRMKSTKDREGGKKVYLKRYEHLSASVEDYFMILGKLNAYKKFREARKVSDDPYELIPYLHRYSESGEAYTRKLAHLIRQNNLTMYDHYSIDPAFFIQDSRW